MNSEMFLWYELDKQEDVKQFIDFSIVLFGKIYLVVY
jgi:hypothetical protein